MKIRFKLLSWAVLILLSHLILNSIGLFDHREDKDPLISHVYNFYNLIDHGEYEEISKLVIEPVWETYAIKKYNFSTLLSDISIKNRLLDDFGVNGWRVSIVAMEIIDRTQFSREEFSKLFIREAQVLDEFDNMNVIKSIEVVTFTGTTTGKCSLNNWIKPIPVITLKDKFLIISKGIPGELDLLHAEQWFTDIPF